MSALEQTKTAVVANPIPKALDIAVVIARVGHIPSICIKVGLLVNNPSSNALRADVSFIALPPLPVALHFLILIHLFVLYRNFVWMVLLRLLRLVPLC